MDALWQIDAITMAKVNFVCVQYLKIERGEDEREVVGI